MQLLERDEVLRISLSVVEDDEDRRTGFIVDDRVISTDSIAACRLGWRHDHGLCTSDELAS